jgi:predicted HTH transcriptional regulator
MKTFKQITEAQFAGNSPNVELMVTFDPEKTAETVCAFANRNGGVIYFGVREKKDGVMKAFQEVTFRPGQRMLPVKEWRETAMAFFGDQKPQIEFEALDSHGKDFPLLIVQESPRRVFLQMVEPSSVTERTTSCSLQRMR